MNRIRNLRKPLLSIFIVVALLTQVLQNVDAGYFADDPSAPYPARYATWVANQAHWLVGQFGWQTGLNAYWRMFSPVHKYDWWWVIDAGRADGSYETLPLPNQVPRGAFEAQFVDFRETKMLLNMWTRKEMRDGYAQMLCRTYAEGKAIRQIRYTLVWRELLSPAVAEQRGTHRETTVYSAVLDEVPCAR